MYIVLVAFGVTIATFWGETGTNTVPVVFLISVFALGSLFGIPALTLMLVAPRIGFFIAGIITLFFGFGVLSIDGANQVIWIVSLLYMISLSIFFGLTKTGKKTMVKMYPKLKVTYNLLEKPIVKKVNYDSDAIDSDMI